MIVRERVLASRLIQKIDKNEAYSMRIGLTYEFQKTKKDWRSEGNVKTCRMLSEIQEVGGAENEK